MQGWLDTAQLFGYAAFVLGVASFLQKTDRRFKIFMALECSAYMAHFMLLGNPSAAASSLVSVTRSVVSIYTRSVWIALIFVGINVALGFKLATVWWNWLPLMASTAGTLAMFLFTGIRMRLLMLLGTLFWIANNVLSGSIGGTALEVIIAATNSYTIYRLWAQARRVPANTQGAVSPDLA
ncbi:YgjV family protein [Rhodoferax sp. U2-2l]|uniref:YgjV family protein n=1 Tax=Rhodoferax sp. U2-2l TaxID=2884000 RepID=UPI001D0AA2E3|nr:YgjV family protein [Rhodoferax sp. U2-2l]